MMVLHAMIVRANDGLPLSASTDYDHQNDVKESKRWMKLLSRKVLQFSNRCTLSTGTHLIHFITSLNLSFFVLCQKDYPAVLAFCFLDEIRKEFIIKYEPEKIQSIHRPYGCIEFDVLLQKTKHRYNSPRSLATRINLTDMSAEIKLHPPFSLTLNDLRAFQSNTPERNLYRPTAGPPRRLAPLSWIGYISLVLNIFCGALNMARGMSAVNGVSTLDWVESWTAYQHGTVFLISSAIVLYQVYLLLYFVKWRTILTCLTIAGTCWCNFYVRELRNIWQIIFHLAVNIFMVVNIITRKFMPKLPDYNV